ncbi:Alpha-1,3/1,6-mannosyltransferase alg-2 [Paramyrothecium foliicola]|nr:Alpha-1,3/1,6-mannosyltransferase alg-2 [Paramyrothecium foliicola]
MFMPPTRDKPADDGGSIVFFHPDLGIGGAERLVVDAAVGLQNRGHKVVVFTNHCDPNHCFDECRDGTLDVRVRADNLIPMSILSRLTILCAILRHLHLLLLIHFSGELAALRPRAFVVDQLSAGLPLLRQLAPRPVLFYCHFPDLLLAQGRERSALKRLYRVPFDWLEESSMGFAQAVAVNSGFTQTIVDRTWPRLRNKVKTRIVYPCVDTAVTTEDGNSTSVFGDDSKVLLSINRFERKKDIGLAIKAFAAIPEAQRKAVRLVLAGGYDPRISENVEYHAELQELAASLNLEHHTINTSTATLAVNDQAPLADVPRSATVVFLLSVPNVLKAALLRSARLLLYTPSNEHFGIVPLEAMLARLPVLAANTGGPVETVVDGVTGWLRGPTDTAAWTDVASRAIAMPLADVRAMGQRGADRVRAEFGRDRMAERLDLIVDEITDPRRTPVPQALGQTRLFTALGFALFMGVGLFISLAMDVSRK